MTKPIRAVLYLRVSTRDQTVENQRRELEATAAQRGWDVVGIYADEGISGAKGRDKRPEYDRMLKDAVRGKFDVIMCWAVDRMGRSITDLINGMQELRGAKVDLFIHQQAFDSATPAGRMMFGMLGLFAEFERAMIQARVNAGLDRAKAKGVKLGRHKVAGEIEDAIRARLEAGVGMVKIAKELGCGTSTVQRVRQEMIAE